ncbi:MAG: DUF4097 family beta strand repeat-containing protein [Defluviitaleaceae bacterium]|nr:DUF4097 family beta strand repeat-containing protein [Defluviitaleaceae bacterium]
MSEARIKILEMLQEGKITVDEAMAMLAQIPEDEQPRQEQQNWDDYNRETNNNNRRESRTYTFDGLADVGSTIKSALSDALGALEDIDIHIDIGGGGKKQHMNFVSTPITTDTIPSLRLLGKNAPVTIHGHEGNEIHINAKYSAKSRGATLHVHECCGSYELLYDYNAVRSVAVECYVPRHILIEQLHGESKNSSLELYDVQANSVELLTKNSKISIEDVKAPNITARTRNGNIHASGIFATHLDLETSNSKIDIEDVTAKIARLITSNAKIETEDVDIQQLYMKTSNASIKLEDAFDFEPETYTEPEFGSQTRPEDRVHTVVERVVEAHTSNGAVQMYIPDDVAVKLQASTSNGRIDSTLTNLIAHEISKNYLHATSQNYDTSTKKARIDIKTSNASVKIKQNE